MVRDRYGAIRRGEDAVMLATRRLDVADLNHRGPRAPLAGTPDRGCRPATRPATGSSPAQHRRLGLINGQRASVLHANRLTGSLLVSFDGDQHPRAIPAEHLDAGNVEHAYAMTIHKAQGLTYDRAY